jgi:hypothetical protein
MISLPVINYPVVEDTNNDAWIDRNDIDVKLTYAEHELICQLLLQAVNMMEFACPYEFFDLPIDTEMIRRFTIIENLRERFNESWSDRFNNNEIH